nr:MAG TPA: protein of unknown function (DUF4577) [Caudoviricetes sp.]
MLKSVEKCRRSLFFKNLLLLLLVHLYLVLYLILHILPLL